MVLEKRRAMAQGFNKLDKGYGNREGKGEPNLGDGRTSGRVKVCSEDVGIIWLYLKTEGLVKWLKIFRRAMIFCFGVL